MQPKLENGQFTSIPPEIRFWEKVNFSSNGCWEWTGYRLKGKYPYGRFEMDGRPVQAHRFSYEYLVGSIPVGLRLDHLCRNPSCVNPAHLEPVTNSKNLLRGNSLDMGRPRREKTCCPKGHPYNEENTYIDPRGNRNCRECRRQVNKRRRLTCRRES